MLINYLRCLIKGRFESHNHFLCFLVVTQDGKEKTAQHVSHLSGVDMALAKEPWNAYVMKDGKDHFVKSRSAMIIV